MTDRIEINPAVMQGKPVVRNTRIPVELVLRKLAEGATAEELMDAYPRLTKDDIQACLGYAADLIAHQDVFVVDPKYDALDSIRSRSREQEVLDLLDGPH